MLNSIQDMCVQKFIKKTYKLSYRNAIFSIKLLNCQILSDFFFFWQKWKIVQIFFATKIPTFKISCGENNIPIRKSLIFYESMWKHLWDTLWSVCRYLCNKHYNTNCNNNSSNITAYLLTINLLYDNKGLKEKLH